MRTRAANASRKRPPINELRPLRRPRCTTRDIAATRFVRARLFLGQVRHFGAAAFAASPLPIDAGPTTGTAQRLQLPYELGTRAGFHGRTLFSRTRTNPTGRNPLNRPKPAQFVPNRSRIPARPACGNRGSCATRSIQRPLESRLATSAAARGVRYESGFRRLADAVLGPMEPHSRGNWR
jgi:hypothetical protein